MDFAKTGLASLLAFGLSVGSFTANGKPTGKEERGQKLETTLGEKGQSQFPLLFQQPQGEEDTLHAERLYKLAEMAIRYKHLSFIADYSQEEIEVDGSLDKIGKAEVTRVIFANPPYGFTLTITNYDEFSAHKTFQDSIELEIFDST